ncbi:tetratricopeptide repeat protein [Bdellovibrionota bacterium FG-1]
MLRTLATLGVCIGMVISVAGCTSNSTKKRYILAEKLWTDGKYSSAVSEFDKVTAKDPKSKLGLQALFRAAATQTLFLSQYEDAVKKFKIYAESPGVDPQLAWDAQKQIGEILFSKTEQYDRAIAHYEGLVKLKPDASEVPEFEFRIAKSHFFLWQFDEAVSDYRQIIMRFKGTVWAEKSALEIGVTHYTRGEQRPGKASREHAAGGGSYQEAITAYEAFLKMYPKSELVPQAKFGIANCLEELGQLNAAYHAYQDLRLSYPAPQVIAIKLARIRERQAQRIH